MFGYVSFEGLLMGMGRNTVFYILAGNVPLEVVIIYKILNLNDPNLLFKGLSRP